MQDVSQEIAPAVKVASVSRRRFLAYLALAPAIVAVACSPQPVMPTPTSQPPKRREDAQNGENAPLLDVETLHVNEFLTIKALLVEHNRRNRLNRNLLNDIASEMQSTNEVVLEYFPQELDAMANDGAVSLLTNYTEIYPFFQELTSASLAAGKNIRVLDPAHDYAFSNIRRWTMLHSPGLALERKLGATGGEREFRTSIVAEHLIQMAEEQQEKNQPLTLSLIYPPDHWLQKRVGLLHFLTDPVGRQDALHYYSSRIPMDQGVRESLYSRRKYEPQGGAYVQTGRSMISF